MNIKSFLYFFAKFAFRSNAASLYSQLQTHDSLFLHNLDSTVYIL